MEYIPAFFPFGECAQCEIQPFCRWREEGCRRGEYLRLRRRRVLDEL